MSAGHQYVDGTRVSSIVSNAADVIEMSVMRAMAGFPKKTVNRRPLVGRGFRHHL